MSLNVGNISARFGLDPAEFLEKMRGVSGATKFFSDEMKRDMRQTSREGAESFRLIDEALGIHISRPLTRMLTQEFPGFAKGLQAVLGIGAVGALAAVGVEVFDKIAKSIEKAQKAQEALRAATANVNMVFAEEISAYKEKDKAIVAATEKVDKLIEAQEKQTKAAEEAAGPWSRLMAGIGDFWTKATSFQSTMDISQISKQLGEFKQKYDMAALIDETTRSRTAVKLLNDELAKAAFVYTELARQAAAGHSLFAPGRGIPKEEVDTAKAYLDQLKQIKAVQDVIDKAVRAKEGQDAAKKTAESLAAFYREIGGATSKIAPDADPIHKLEAEITAARVKAVADFDEMRKAGASALNMDHALAALGRLEAMQDRVLANAKATAAVTAAQAGLPTTIAATGRAPAFAAPTAMPNAAGVESHAAAKLDVFSKDDQAQMQMAAQAYEQAMTAQQKYDLGKQELDLLVQKGLIDTNAEKAALAQLEQQMVKAADSTHKLQMEMQKLLERSNDAAAGIKAFGMQLQITAAENGKFAYDVLNAATKGFEEDATKTLMDLLYQQRGGHQQLIRDLESMWGSYFKNLASMAIKFQMDKLLAPLGKALAPGDQPQNAGQPQSGTSTSSASTSIWSKIFGAAAPKSVPGGGGGAGVDSLTHAGTMLQTAATALQQAASTLSASGGGGGGGGGLGGLLGGGSGGGDGTPWESLAPALDTFSGFFARGGDATPGSSFISGEAGAERVDLDRSGGAHITPLGVTAGGGDVHNHNYDMRGAVVTDDLMRKADAASAIHASESRMMSAMPAMQKEISLRKRS